MSQEGFFRFSTGCLGDKTGSKCQTGLLVAKTESAKNLGKGKPSGQTFLG
jgi:hypothetical protein